MSVLPEEITSQAFRTRWRGYDRAQVDGFLRRLAMDYTAAMQRLAVLTEERGRANVGQDELTRMISSLAEQARAATEQARRDAEQDATRVRERGEQAAGAILDQAEQAAGAVLRQAHQLRASAEEDVVASRREAEEARRRRDVDAAVAERRRDALRALESRLAGRLRDTDHALGELRTRVDMLGEVHRLEELIAAVRSDTWAEWAEMDGTATSGTAQDGAGSAVDR